MKDSPPLPSPGDFRTLTAPDLMTILAASVRNLTPDEIAETLEWTTTPEDFKAIFEALFTRLERSGGST